MYSFHTSEACMKETYEQVGRAYERIFERLELSMLRATASSGAMGGTASHEYHIESPIGEDTVFVCRKCGECIAGDLAQEESPDKTPACSKCGASIDETKLDAKRCIELGHTFMLADRYTKCFPIKLSGGGGGGGGARTADGADSAASILMGCYGIGVTRLMQACVEARHVDAHFPAWPVEIAPFKVCIVTAKRGSKEADKSGQLVPYLSNMLDTTSTFHNEVLVDDRDSMSIGGRLIDASLLGVPYLIVLGKCVHDEQAEIIVMDRGVEAKKLTCHTRETAVVLKQLHNDYLYARGQRKLTNYFAK